MEEDAGKDGEQQSWCENQTDHHAENPENQGNDTQVGGIHLRLDGKPSGLAVGQLLVERSRSIENDTLA